MTATSTTTTTDIEGRPRNLALILTRVFAGVLGGFQLAGAAFFLFVVPEEAVWVGLWLDVPVVAVMMTGMALKLVVAIWPGLSPRRRIELGFLAVGLGVAVTLLKIPVYDEPEGVLFLLLDALLLLGLVLAARTERHATHR